MEKLCTPQVRIQTVLWCTSNKFQLLIIFYISKIRSCFNFNIRTITSLVIDFNRLNKRTRYVIAYVCPDKPGSRYSVLMVSCMLRGCQQFLNQGVEHGVDLCDDGTNITASSNRWFAIDRSRHYSHQLQTPLALEVRSSMVAVLTSVHLQYA